jgi:hypothetical protein
MVAFERQKRGSDSQTAVADAMKSESNHFEELERRGRGGNRKTTSNIFGLLVD